MAELGSTNRYWQCFC